MKRSDRLLFSPAGRSLFESPFKAPKTPPSHGLTGLAAIKPIAKCGRQGFRGQAPPGFHARERRLAMKFFVF